jgi:cell division protein FtsB
MENGYYRPSKRSRPMREFLRWIRREPRRAAIVAAGIIAGFYVLLNNKGVITRLQLEAERREIAERVQAAEQETKELQAQLKALEGDKKTIEKIARERHGMAREGETVYRMKKEK